MFFIDKDTYFHFIFLFSFLEIPYLLLSTYKQERNRAKIILVIPMTLYDIYFLITMITIVITRILVYIFNKPSPTIKNFRTHHWMFGFIFILILFCISSFYTNIYLLSISTGIFLDEIGFIILKGKTHEDNYSPESFMILLFFILLLFLFRENIVRFYL